jgi:hypothetical protein
LYIKCSRVSSCCSLSCTNIILAVATYAKYTPDIAYNP